MQIKLRARFRNPPVAELSVPSGDSCRLTSMFTLSHPVWQIVSVRPGIVELSPESFYFHSALRRVKMVPEAG